MKNWITKYKSRTSTLIIAAYILLNLSNVFHYHHYEYKSKSCVNVNLNSESHRISAAGFECSVHQNFNSLHTLTFPKSSSITDTFQRDNHKLILSSENFLSENFNSSNPLRAPPKIS